MTDTEKLAHLIFNLEKYKTQLSPQTYKELKTYQDDKDENYLDTSLRLMLISWEREDMRLKGR